METQTSALRQDTDQCELLLRSLQQNLTMESVAVDPTATAAGAGVGADTTAGLGLEGLGMASALGGGKEDWTFAEEHHWHNVPGVAKYAISTLGRLVTQQSHFAFAMASKVDETAQRVSRIEDSFLKVEKSISYLTKGLSENNTRLDRSEARRGAFSEQWESDVTAVKEQQDKLVNELISLRSKNTTLTRLDENVDRLERVIQQVQSDEIPTIKRRMERVSAYEGNLQAVLAEVRELQDTAITARYNGSAAAVGSPSVRRPPVGAAARSTGRWLWEGRKVLNARSSLVQWDSRCLETGDAFRWYHDDKRYVIDVRRGGLYKLSLGAVSTNSSINSDVMMLYIDDDALLSSVHSTSFVAHTNMNTRGSPPGSSSGQVKRLANTRHRTPHSHCCAADCTAGCFTSLTSTDFIYLPARAFLCVRCTADPSDIVCGFLEIQEFA